VRLPAYPFTRREHWIGKARTSERAAGEPTPLPAADTPAGGDELIAVLTDIWRRVLGVDHVGLDDDFFDVGGDSLTAVQLVAAIERRLGLKLQFMSLEQHSL